MRSGTHVKWPTRPVVWTVRMAHEVVIEPSVVTMSPRKRHATFSIQNLMVKHSSEHVRHECSGRMARRHTSHLALGVAEARGVPDGGDGCSTRFSVSLRIRVLAED